MEIPKIFKSSVDPQKLSLTVKGFIVSIIPVVIAIAGLAHLNLGQQDITAFGDSIIVLVDSIAKVCAAIMVVWGILRKMGVALGVVGKKN